MQADDGDVQGQAGFAEQRRGERDADLHRVALQRYEADAARQQVEMQTALAQLVKIAERIAAIRERTGRGAPTVMT